MAFDQLYGFANSVAFAADFYNDPEGVQNVTDFTVGWPGAARPEVGDGACEACALTLFGRGGHR
ncbi:MAG: hypothetical protein OXF75_01455 [Acidimicrobiaceae bacterium]|nr:hypothetical protein [Acidimicrobiaceae bacterium]